MSKCGLMIDMYRVCGDDGELCSRCQEVFLLRRERDEAREDAALSRKQYADVSDELAELRARVKEVPRTTEWHIAMRYANQIRDADAYFAARAEMLDSGHNRHLFEAGYQRGSDAGEKVYAGTAAAAVPEAVAKYRHHLELLRDDCTYPAGHVGAVVLNGHRMEIIRDALATILAAKEKGK